MKILVTGNLGYVGAHLTQILIDAGHEVIGCDLSLFPDSVSSPLISPSVQWNIDFRDISTAELSGIDAIAHLAGISNDPMGQLDSGLTNQINGEGTVNFAEKAKLANVKIFTFASSCSIYGSNGTLPRTELDPTNPLSEYASSKFFAEQGISKLADDDYFVYILRNATAYGASPVLRLDLVVNDLSAGMCAEGNALIKSDGSPWRPLIHCRDMARAFQLFMENNPVNVSGKPVNIGFDSENFQVKEIGSLVAKSWPHGNVSYQPNAVSDPRDYKVNFSLFKSIFPNFTPMHPLSVGVPELREYLLEINYSSSERSAGKFIRLKELDTRKLIKNGYTEIN